MKGLAPKGASPFLLLRYAEYAKENPHNGARNALSVSQPQGDRWLNMAGKAIKENVRPTSVRPTSLKRSRFRVGDLAVYPAHGVGQIQAVESRVVNGEKHDFYILKVLENGMVIMIPTSNVDSVGLRCLIDVKEIPKVYAVMRTKREMLADNQTWNRRYREYMEKIKTGSLFDVAEVFRDLFRLKLTKDLSFGERKLYDTAQVLLVKELSKAKKTDEKTIISEIESLFAHEAA
jgi:CarD family transcriptional regulator